MTKDIRDMTLLELAEWLLERDHICTQCGENLK